jgi:RES domain-containing protein
LELLVHVTRDAVPSDLILIPVDVPNEMIDAAGALPADWNELPYSLTARQFGDRWLRSGRSLALFVPSVIVPGENNLLINPSHTEFRAVEVRPAESFGFDSRLLR